MPKKRISTNTTRKKATISEIDFEDVELLSRIEQLAYDGFYDTEIADKLNISRWQFDEAKRRSKKLTSTLETARERARTQGAEMPSPALFAEVWARCNGKRTQLMREFGIGWTKLQSWLAKEPTFVDIMAERDLEFLEQVDVASRILALGGVKGKDNFAGWSRFPDSWMIRFHLNTLGKRYGYGENPMQSEAVDSDIPKNIEQGIDIDSWIRQEVEQKKQNSEKSDNDEIEQDDNK